jgi:hypothetical protein
MQSTGGRLFGSLLLTSGVLTLVVAALAATVSLAFADFFGFLFFFFFILEESSSSGIGEGSPDE